MATVGKVHDITKGTKEAFEWEIKNFFSLSKKVDKSYRSPPFSFAGISWYLCVLPNGSQKDNTVGYVGVFIYKEETDIPITLSYSLSLKSSSGKKSHEMQSTNIFQEPDNAWGLPTFVKRSTLLERKSELVPSEILTIIFAAESYAKNTEETNSTLEPKLKTDMFGQNSLPYTPILYMFQENSLAYTPVLYMATLGKVQDVTKDCFEWEINKFFSLSKKIENCYKSPSFSFAGSSWYFVILPHGSQMDNTVGYVGVYIYKEETDTPFALSWSLSLKTSSGKKSHEMLSTFLFQESDNSWGIPRLVKRSTLSERKSELVPSEILTITFTAKSYSKSADGINSILEPKLKADQLEQDMSTLTPVSDMEIVGKIQDVTNESFEWKIEKFFSLQKKVDKCYKSPLFSFADTSWYLIILPYGSQVGNYIGYVGVYIYREETDTNFTLSWSLNLKTSNGNESHKRQSTNTFQEGMDFWGFPTFVKRSVLSKKKSQLMPSDVLTIVFTAVSYSKSTDETNHIVTSPCSYCKKSLDVKDVSSHEQTYLDRPIKCPICKTAIALRNWPEHECVTATIKEDDVVNDLAKLLESEEHSDFTVKVKDTEFRLHRSILAARNPYFNSMFKAQMIENKTGAMSINDCEPHIFRTFVHFVYTGKLQALSYNNVCALYKVADIYQQDQLKAECLRFMKNKISTDSFCDFVLLALMHNEKELLHNAIHLFSRKTKEIIQTVKWQTFMREYPTQANELHIKSLDYNAR